MVLICNTCTLEFEKLAKKIKIFTSLFFLTKKHFKTQLLLLPELFLTAQFFTSLASKTTILGLN
jgi:hypothetical protein